MGIDNDWIPVLTKCPRCKAVDTLVLAKPYKNQTRFRCVACGRIMFKSDNDRVKPFGRLPE